MESHALSFYKYDFVNIERIKYITKFLAKYHNYIIIFTEKIQKLRGISLC